MVVLSLVVVQLWQIHSILSDVAAVVTDVADVLGAGGTAPNVTEVELPGAAPGNGHTDVALTDDDMLWSRQGRRPEERG